MANATNESSDDSNQNNDAVLSLDEQHEATIQELDSEENVDQDDQDNDQQDDNNQAGESEQSDDAANSEAESTDSESDEEEDQEDSQDDTSEEEKTDDDEEVGSDLQADLDAMFGPIDDEEDEDKGSEKSETSTDTSEAGEGKVAVKDLDGEVHYFNKLAEVPDDFEPASQVQWAKAVKEFDRKEAEEAQGLSESIKAENEKALKDINKGWRIDVETLIKTGELPSEREARDSKIAQVFDFMRDEAKNGNIIHSFVDAFEKVQYRESQSEKIAEEEKRKKDAANLKKEKGSRITSSGNKPTGRPKVIDGPPAGVGLDTVHEHVLGSL